MNNEYSHDGITRAIPPTLLISAIGQIPDVRRCVTMDFKEAGNLIVILGMTRNEMGGSLWADMHGLEVGKVPSVVPALGQSIFRAVYLALSHGLVRSCHDLSEGGLAVALAEMAFAGGLGATVSLRDIPCENDAAHDPILLFAETPSRFLLELAPQNYAALADLVGSLPMGKLGEVTPSMEPAAARLSVKGLSGDIVIDAPVNELKKSWQEPLNW